MGNVIKRNKKGGEANSSAEPQAKPDSASIKRILDMLPKRGKRDQFVMVVKPDEKNKDKPDGVLPLQKIGIDAKIEGAFATVDLDLIYLNPSHDTTLEACYEFPLEKTTLLSKLTAEINGKTIEAEVRSKETAKEKYDDAMASGHAAVLAERDTEKKESMTIRLGNIQPDQTARLRITLLI